MGVRGHGVAAGLVVGESYAGMQVGHVLAVHPAAGPDSRVMIYAV